MSKIPQSVKDTFAAARAAYKPTIVAVSEPIVEVECVKCGDVMKVEDKRNCHLSPCGQWLCRCCVEEHTCARCNPDDEDAMEDCDCGYTHHYEDKCPTGTQVAHYVRWANRPCFGCTHPIPDDDGEGEGFVYKDEHYCYYCVEKTLDDDGYCDAECTESHEKLETDGNVIEHWKCYKAYLKETKEKEAHNGWDTCEKCDEVFENEPGCPKICGECETETKEKTTHCSLCDVVIGSRNDVCCNTCCMCSAITLCDTCCPESETKEHTDDCWDECKEYDYPHRVCKECEQYNAMCANECGTMLTIDCPINTLTRGEEEETWCSTCVNDLRNQIKKEGWTIDDETE